MPDLVKLFKDLKVHLTFLLTISFLITLYLKHITYRGGFDWDELYLVRAATLGDNSYFLDMILPEPTPPLQALFFRVIVQIGLNPTEFAIRSTNIFFFILIYCFFWIFIKKNSLFYLGLVLTSLYIINFYPLSFVSVARPYFLSYLVILFGVLVWHRDFTKNYKKSSKLLVFITVLASFLHFYGALVFFILYLTQSIYLRRIYWQSIVASVLPYSLWFLGTYNYAEVKIARTSFMESPRASSVFNELYGTVFGGRNSFLVVLLGLILLTSFSVKKQLTFFETKNLNSGLILLISALLTILFAYFFSNFKPIWMNRNIMLIMPLITLSSAIGLYLQFKRFRRRNFTLITFVIIYTTIIFFQALFLARDDNKIQSEGHYKETVSYVISENILRDGAGVVGWEDTQVYEFYLSNLGFASEMNLKFLTRFSFEANLKSFTQPSDKISQVVVLSSDEPIDRDFVSLIEDFGFDCKSLQLSKSHIFDCKLNSAVS